MDSQTEIIEIKPKNMFVPICITQAVCIVVILLALVIIKFFFVGSYEKFEDWYKNNIMDETKITAVFDEETNSEI